MTIITTYVAEDGTAFEDKDACEKYEFSLKYGNIANYLRLYDANYQRIDLNNPDEFDRTYFICWDNEEALAFLNELWFDTYCKSIEKEIGETLHETGKYFYIEEAGYNGWISLQEFTEDIERLAVMRDNFAAL